MNTTKNASMKSNREKNIADIPNTTVKVVDELPFCSSDDDLVLLRKEEDAIKSFQETPWPEFLLKRIEKKD